MCLAQGPQHSDAGEARTGGPSVSSQALNHWATALPIEAFTIKQQRKENISLLTLKAPITTAADDKFNDIFPNFWKYWGMIFQENRLPADDSHEISCLICYIWKSSKIWKCRLLQIIGGALGVNPNLPPPFLYTRYGNRQMLPRPTMYPRQESINSSFTFQFPRSWFSGSEESMLSVLVMVIRSDKYPPAIDESGESETCKD